MDKQEEEGLRACELRVGRGPSAGDSPIPLWVEHDGMRRQVARIDATWREEERIGFHVRFEHGPAMVLYYVPELDLWSGVLPGRPGEMRLRRADTPPRDR